MISKSKLKLKKKNLSRDDEARVGDLDELENVLYAIECLIDFYQEEEYLENFPMVRRAIVNACRSAQALRTPVILNQNPEPEAAETLVIQIGRASCRERV